MPWTIVIMGDVMVLNIHTQDVSITGDNQVPIITKVKAVTTNHSLPQDGKNLPQNNQQNQSNAKQGNLEQVVQEMNDHVQLVKRQLEFRIDDESGRTVITVLDSNTQEIIRQIPNDEALKFARKLHEGDVLEIFDKFV
ncbi:MAG: hypothetical protein COB77_04740 [Gammaproteobacteria bacterium]|nr:MAG: hypothetical protein COB77_04740 [Gammaproteobacteria bacterium]